MSDIPILPVFEHLGGRLARQKFYGWSTAYCVLPEHDDRNASAQLNEETNRFRCLACSVNEDAIGLIMRIEGVRFPDAKRRITEITGVDSGPLSRQSRPRNARLLGREGHRPSSGGWVPPWRVRRPDA